MAENDKPNAQTKTQSKPQGAWKTADFDFALPQQLIAQHPAPERTASRLLDGRSSTPQDLHFRQLPQLLQKDDLLIFNNTKVVKARLYGAKTTGAKLELLVERVLPPTAGYPHHFAAHMKGKKPSVGDTFYLGENTDGNGNRVQATLLGRWPDANSALFHIATAQDPYAIMQAHGHVPLPPYITHADSADDIARYQTVFATEPGAVAAPTAALHFSEALIQQLEQQGVETAAVTLHVGAGTFQPVKADDIADHTMHSERYHIPPETIAAIAQCRARGGRVVAVGTTSVRTLESWAKTGQTAGETDIFITPGFHFEVVDMLITNFHLPQSTLLMLVSAFAGYRQIMRLYRYAIAQEYRFFSYGDAMLLSRATQHLCSDSAVASA